MAAMNEVSDFLPDTVLLDYIRAQIPSNDKLWTFRKHLAVQYACQVTCRALQYRCLVRPRCLARLARRAWSLHGLCFDARPTRDLVRAACEQVLVSHALFCAPPTPSKLVLSKQQGDVMLVGMTPGFNKDNSKMSDDHLESGSVPFRMTRMMTILLSSVGLQGGFSASMGAAAMALTHPQRMLKQHLYSILREEILSYGFPNPTPGQPLQSARSDHGKLVNQRAIDCAGQVRIAAIYPPRARPRLTACAAR
jgi:hypothetical protein